eukprot:NODE_1108_length_2181_cov_0.661864.p1 type:complete len:270 gc:universal NODE_1108_length_2181_cov_0.661864:1017-1826(+)
MTQFQYFPNRNRPFHPRQIGTLLGIASISFYLLSDKAPFTNRRRLILTSSYLEDYLANQSYQDILYQSRHAILPTNNPYHMKSSQIIHKLLVKNKEYLNPNINWQIHVIQSPELNAFVLPNGKIFIYTGLFRILNENELAAVLSHELSHVVARHSAETMSFMNLLTGISAFLGIPVIGLESLMFNKYSRTLEFEADEIGLHLMTNACYDPNYAMSVWDQFQKVQQREPIEFLSTHPNHSNRKEKIRQNLEKVGDWKLKCEKQLNWFFNQ